MMDIEEENKACINNKTGYAEIDEMLPAVSKNKKCGTFIREIF